MIIPGIPHDHMGTGIDVAVKKCGNLLTEYVEYYYRHVLGLGMLNAICVVGLNGFG